MNLKSLRALVHVMDEGSLIAAAERMNLSQPAVSRLIQLLEAELSTQLFYRNRKSLAPTPEADLLYPEARRVLMSVDGFADLFASAREGSVPLRVVSQMRAAHGLVIPALARFAGEFPRIRTSLDLHARSELGRRVQEERFDVGVCVVPLQVEGVALSKVYRSRLEVLLPKDHALAQRASLASADLANIPYIALKRGLLAREAVDRAIAHVEQRLTPQHEVSSTAAAQRLVAAGVGFCFSDPAVLDPHFTEAMRLVPFAPRITLDLGIYTPKTPDPHPATDAFLTCLEAVWRECQSKADAEFS